MRIAFSTTVLARGLATSGVDGIGAYTRELGVRLAVRPGVSLVPVGFRDAVAHGVLPGAQAPEVLCRYAPAAIRCALLPTGFPAAALSRRGVELFHATDHLVPKFAKLPVVATLMDAIPLSHPEWVRRRFAPLKRWLWRRAARWADHVITISEYSKSEIVSHFGIGPERISVTPLGVDARYFERLDTAQRELILGRLGLPPTFFLFVGTLQPRKNLERALEAHASLPARIRGEMPFVVVGRAGWSCERLVARLEGGDRAQLRWFGYLPDLQLRALMQSATALVFTSLAEGFGLPVAEAFASGLPVIASRTTSIPEVAGDAALLVDPTRVDEIAQAMIDVAETPALASRMAVAGLERARALGWDACADRTLGVYRRLL